jgi:tRNA pseudouridine38-40 synthase
MVEIKQNYATLCYQHRIPEVMQRYFVELAYNGSRYHGWQIQPNATTVQSALETAIKTITGKDFKTTGAGRTDTGVHARFFVAHVNSDHPLFSNTKQFVYKINCVLPADIAVHKIYPVRSDAHARFSALSRTYEYTVSRVKDPFCHDVSWYYTRPLNVAAMNLASAMLKEINDFTSFSKLHTDVKTNHCQVLYACWSENPGKLIFTIQADRFLRNMVRALVGTLIHVGLQKISPEEFRTIALKKDRRLAAFSAPACGLSLTAIAYPEQIRVPVKQG